MIGFGVGGNWGSSSTPYSNSPSSTPGVGQGASMLPIYGNTWGTQSTTPIPGNATFNGAYWSAPTYTPPEPTEAPPTMPTPPPPPAPAPAPSITMPTPTAPQQIDPMQAMPGSMQYAPMQGLSWKGIMG